MAAESCVKTGSVPTEKDHGPHPQHRCVTEGFGRGVRFAIGVHALAQSRPLAVGDQASHVARAEAGRQCLLMGDEPVLGASRPVALEIHEGSVGAAAAVSDCSAWHLWRSPCGADL